MQWLLNLYSLTEVLRELYYERPRVKAKAIGILQPYIQTAEQDNDGSLGKGVLYKLKDYPQEAIFAGRFMAELAGLNLGEKEERYLSICGALLALGDVMNDDTQADVNKVHGMLNEPHHYKGSNSVEKLFLQLYKDLLIMMDDKLQVFFHQAFLNGFEAEKESRLLFTHELPAADVLRIAKAKGAASLLIYRSIFNTPLPDAEKKLLEHCGALTQLMDDIFDLHWDYKKNLSSSACIHTSWDQLEKQLEEQFQLLCQQMKATSFEPQRQRKFLFTFALFSEGVKAYILQMRKLTDDVLRPETILALHEEQIKFRYFTWSNVRNIIPALLRFRF